MTDRTFYEFFAGGGMARAGFGPDWVCTFANDFDPMKGGAYTANWGSNHLLIGDINQVRVDQLPGEPDVVWASFPCQDLSLAGNAEGLGTETEQTRSGAFWALWRLLQGLQTSGRAPPIIVLENVYGVLTANGGREFAAIGRCLSLTGYRFGAVLLDGKHFVPQSRPRVFIVGVRSDLEIPYDLRSAEPIAQWHPPAMGNAIARLAELDGDQWFWLKPPLPKSNPPLLGDLIDDEPVGVAWHSSAETSRLLAMMSDASLAKLAAMKGSGCREVGTIYKRTRSDNFGRKVQRAELRNDGIAGCLRTPGGGSSRQFVLIATGDHIQTRLLSPREAARLMGLPDSYILPKRYNDAYHVAGDGLIVPAVRFLVNNVIEPVLDFNSNGAMSLAAE